MCIIAPGLLERLVVFGVFPFSVVVKQIAMTQ